MKIKPNHFASLRNTKQKMRSDGKKYTIRSNRDRFFFPDEWQAFYDALKPKQKITFNTLINTGARINEARNIKVQDIDFERCSIVLRVTKKIIRRPRTDKHGKASIRIISVSPKFVKFLKETIKNYKLKTDGYLPILSTPAANIAMKKTLQKIGVKDWDMFSIHNIRKTLETWLIALDVDSFKIVKHFGHSINVALKHYISPDVFNYQDKQQMRQVIGDLYQER